MKKKYDSAIYVRGKPITTRTFITLCLKHGLDKRTIRGLCKDLEITNFVQTWARVVA